MIMDQPKSLDDRMIRELHKLQMEREALSMLVEDLRPKRPKWPNRNRHQRRVIEARQRKRRKQEQHHASI